MTTVSTLEERSQSRAAKWGWGILIGMSVLLLLAGLSWYFNLPQLALDNIAEYANLESADFMQGTPSSFDVITGIARGYGAGYACLGLLGLLVGLEGYRNGRRWAWIEMWVLALAYIAIAGIFLLGGESYALSLGIFTLAVVTIVGLFLARRGLEV